MTKIGQPFLDTAIYLYPDADEADNGSRAGGSGFLVSVPASDSANNHVFAVTNKHVIVGEPSRGVDPAPVIRLNTEDGSQSVIPLKEGQWIKADRDDLAVALIVETDLRHYRYQTVPLARFVTEDEAWEDRNISTGTPCFMVGRFIGQDGRQRNYPAARFGNLSLMPYEEIETRYGIQTAFIVEMHSISGFSGSPVFTYPHFAGWGGPKNSISQLLGVDCGHLTVDQQMVVADKAPGGGLYAQGNSGGAIVVAAWRLHALLTDDPRTKRAMETEEMRTKKRDEGYSLDSASHEPQVSGKEPERLKIDAPMDEAVKKMFEAGKPPRE